MALIGLPGLPPSAIPALESEAGYEEWLKGVEAEAKRLGHLTNLQDRAGLAAVPPAIGIAPVFPNTNPGRTQEAQWNSLWKMVYDSTRGAVRSYIDGLAPLNAHGLDAGQLLHHISIRWRIIPRTLQRTWLKSIEDMRWLPSGSTDIRSFLDRVQKTMDKCPTVLPPAVGPPAERQTANVIDRLDKLLPSGFEQTIVVIRMQDGILWEQMVTHLERRVADLLSANDAKSTTALTFFGHHAPTRDEMHANAMVANGMTAGSSGQDPPGNSFLAPTDRYVGNHAVAQLPDGRQGVFLSASAFKKALASARKQARQDVEEQQEATDLAFWAEKGKQADKQRKKGKGHGKQQGKHGKQQVDRKGPYNSGWNGKGSQQNNSNNKGSWNNSWNNGWNNGGWNQGQRSNSKGQGKQNNQRRWWRDADGADEPGDPNGSAEERETLMSQEQTQREKVNSSHHPSPVVCESESDRKIVRRNCELKSDVVCRVPSRKVKKRKLKVLRRENRRSRNRIEKAILRHDMKEQVGTCSLLFDENSAVVTSGFVLNSIDRSNRIISLSGLEEEASLVDTGSSRYLSRVRSDFMHVEDESEVKISGTAGVSTGRSGVLRDNVFGLKYGVFFPTLPNVISRILPWLGEGNLASRGFDLISGERRSYLVGHKRGPLKIVKVESADSLDLPIVTSNIFVKRATTSVDIKLWKEVLQMQNDREKSISQKMERRGTSFLGNHTGDEILCSPCEEQDKNLSDGSSYLSKFEQHCRYGRFHIKGMNVLCPICAKTKGQRSSHSKIRPAVQVYKPLRTLAVDFSGSVGATSIRSRTLALVIVCDCVKFVVVKPITLKTEVSSVLDQVFKELTQKYQVSKDEKAIWFLRRDNEPALGDKHMTNVLRAASITDIPTVPYSPEMDGTVERYMRTVLDSLRAALIGVDKLLWCFGIEYLAETWNRLPHECPKLPIHNGKSPLQILEEKIGRQTGKSDTSRLRRFGCLVYYKQQVEKGREEEDRAKKLVPKWCRGVFLGFCPKSSGWLVGAYVQDNRAKLKYSWRTYSTLGVKFFERILVADLKWLVPNAPGVFIPFDRLDHLHEAQEKKVGLGPTSRTNHPSGLDPSPPEPSAEALIKSRSPGMLDEGFIWPDSENESGESKENTGTSPNKLEEGNKSDRDSEGETSESEPEQLQRRRKAKGKPKAKSKSKRASHTVDSKVKHRGKPSKRGKPRGRPAGSKDSGKRVRRTKAQIEADLKNLEYFAALAHEEFEPLQEGENFAEAHIMLSVKQALASADMEKWREAIDKEKARLLLFETWEPATTEELAAASQVIPIAVILTVKRCGRYKARAVVLGNLDRSGEVETFAPVVSHAANRLLLTASASEGDFVLPFDLDSAFLNAEIERTALVSLPDAWVTANQPQIVKLKKALYGLKEAPRAWFKRYAAILHSLGWTACPEAPGLWRKESKAKRGRFLKMSVYVDDNLICGPDMRELREELESILAQAPGQILPMEEYRDSRGKKWQTLDFLGSDVHYSRECRSMRVSMRTYIRKMLAKFQIKPGKRVLSPNYNEGNMTQCKKELETYPSRSMIGALQWVSTTCRPDIAAPVNTLAKYVGEKPTKAFARAVLKVWRYLDTTQDDGISYSPEGEERFNEIYGKLLPEGRPIPRTHLFSDASFANCLKTLRSTSGSIVYFRGCAIAWKTQKQGVRAYSTAEAEYISASDTIVLSETTDFLSFYEKIPTELTETAFGIANPREDAILWVDNQSAITISKSEDTKPKSRHYALRYLRVRDYAEQICFCPTNLQKADGLTKLECSTTQRRLLLHHVDSPVISKRQKINSDEEDEDSSSEEIPSYSDFQTRRKKKPKVRSRP